MIHRIEQRIAGLSLILAGVLIVFIMMHHPTNSETAVLSAWVHGGMIGVILLTTIGVSFWGVISAQGPLLRVSGTLLFFVGSLLNILAAALNGFIVPEIFERFGDEVSRDLHGFAWSFNQTMARIAVVVHAAAMFIFSLQSSKSHAPKTEAAFRGIGLVAGVLSVGILIVHRGSMDVHTALAIYSLEAIWIFTLGLLMTFAGPRFRGETLAQ